MPEACVPTLLREIWFRFCNNLYARAGAPFTFRLILQPLVAGLIAIRAGLRDARAGRRAYLWSIYKDSGARLSLIKNGWQDIARVFTLAIAIDLIYQIVVIGWIYPLETLALAVIVAVLPYLVVRGLTNRAARSKTFHFSK